MRVIRKSEKTSVIEESEREPSEAQKRRHRSGEYVSRILTSQAENDPPIIEIGSPDHLIDRPKAEMPLQHYESSAPMLETGHGRTEDYV